MEDVLEVYTRPYDSKRPLVCMDETSKQLIGETRLPLPFRGGRPQRYDYEYTRNGVSNLFMAFEPLAGRRQVKVTDRRTRRDWAELMRELVDKHYPEAEVITLVLDNLNTHTTASLYEAFAPAEARRIARRLELHYTPKHGSWLNMAEIALSVLSRQCLDQRIPDKAALEQEVAAWTAERNRAAATVDWRFTTDDARIKLKKLYPSMQE
jgi:transposase